MKVVINNCYGGFSLSLEGCKKYAELAGFKIFAYQSDYDRGVEAFCRAKEDCFSPYTIKQDIGDFPTSEVLNGAEWFHDRDLDRSDPILIEVVEILGDKANGGCANLKIVEIPDGTDYEICEYDGNEHIAEKHQTWS